MISYEISSEITSEMVRGHYVWNDLRNGTLDHNDLWSAISEEITNEILHEYSRKNINVIRPAYAHSITGDEEPLDLSQPHLKSKGSLP